ncbi:MAG: fused MFS/spermidine synthase [Chloroflexota bacterium]|nr:fused MFS/spermidine synthase [Chloroflexota bacterium]
MSMLATAAAVRPATHVGAVGLLWGLVALFFVSGACGLVYQVLWVRLLSLSFGITVYAVTVVLSSFMAGLAIGSFLGGRYAERLRRPLVVYALIELVVGLVALATPALFDGLQWLYPYLSRGVGGSEPVLFVVRVVVAFAILAVPTALMGATLPIIVKSSLAEHGQIANRIGLLYTANTCGAIFGTVVAGFWLIGGIGITASIMVAAATNGVVGLAALLLHWLTAGPTEARSEAMTVIDGERYSARARQVTLIAYGLAGVCSFAFEVAWTRMLALVLDTSIYAFVTMLSMVLIGIAVGSGLMTPFIRRRWNWPLVFAVLELLLAAATIWAIWAIAKLPEIQLWMSETRGFNRLVFSPLRFNVVIAALTILPSTLLIGATFPIAARVYTAGLDRSSERLGQIYAVNVFGAIFGSMLGGFVLLPLLGTQASLLLLAVASLGIAAALALAADTPRLSSRAVLIGAGAAAFAVLWLTRPDVYASLFRARFPGQDVTWFKEGIETTVSIVKGGDGVRTLYTNARGQANDEPELVKYHRRIAHMPLLIRPQAKDVLIVGLGVGHTAGSILQHEGTHVHVVELSDAILGGAAQFSNVNYGALRDPRLTLELGDGRNFLLTAAQQFDLITTDTIQPFDAGSTNLYSVEYYRLAAKSLKPGGMMAQWIGPHDDFQYKTMLRTYLEVFPYVTLWLTADLVIGSNDPIDLDLGEVAQRFESPRTRAALLEAGFGGPGDAAGAFVADRAEIERFVGPGPVLSDDHPMIEYYRSAPGRGRGAPPDLWSGFSRDPSKILRR